MAPPPGGSAPPSGTPSSGSSIPSDSLGRALDEAKALGERVRGLSDDDDESEDEPQERTESPREAVQVDYGDVWAEDPPPPPQQRTVVVTTVVHRPTRPTPPVPDEPDEPEATPQPPRARGFVGLSVRGTTTNHNPSALTGARAGFTFGDRLTIGGAFYSLTARYASPIMDPRGNELGLRMAYGGVLLGWTPYSGRVVQLTVSTLAGAGAGCVSVDGNKQVGRWHCRERVGLVSIEPGMELAFVVSDWMRLGVDAGWRFVTREAWRPPNDFTLSGPYVGLNLDFGAFRTRKR